MSLRLYNANNANRPPPQESTFLAESSKEFFTADPSHLSIFTGLSSIFHCKTNRRVVHQETWYLTESKVNYFLKNILKYKYHLLLSSDVGQLKDKTLRNEGEGDEGTGIR